MVISPGKSSIEYVNVRSLEIPVTTKLPLNPELAAPTVLTVLFTLLITIFEPTLRLCAFSEVTLTTPPL